MPQDATCPKCSHSFPVTEARHAYTVACPRCEAELTAEFLKPATPPEAGQPPYDLKVKAGALPGAAAAAPTRRRKSDDDEPKRKGGSAMVVLVSGGLGLLFVIGGLSVTAWFLFTQVDVEPTTRASTSNNNSNNNRNTPPRVTPIQPTQPNNPNARPNVNPNFNPNPNPWVNPIPNPAFPNPNPGFNPEPFKPPVAPAKKETFTLAPVAAAVPPIEPPANIDPAFTTQVQLPGRAEYVAVGGGGRYIVLLIPSVNKLVAFDANTGGLLANEAAIDPGTGMLAAGADRVVVGLPGGKKFRVYSLPGLQQQLEFESPLFFGMRSIAIGNRTNGPMLGGDPFGRCVLFDITTGQVVEGSEKELRDQGVQTGQLRASPDGKTFLAGNGHIRGQEDGFKLLDESGGRWRVRDAGVSAAYFGPDGRRVYGKNQIGQTAGAPLAGRPAAVAGDVWYVPATTPTGNLFLRVNETKVGTPPRVRNGVGLSVHRDRGVDTAVASWEGLQEMEGLAHSWGTEPLDRHLFLIPEAKLLVILTRDKNKLVVRKLTI
jgi:hypothetical protein